MLTLKVSCGNSSHGNKTASAAFSMTRPFLPKQRQQAKITVLCASTCEEPLQNRKIQETGQGICALQGGGGMINKPFLIESDSFQNGWLQAVRLLSLSRWELYNLVVHIARPAEFDSAFHTKIVEFAETHNTLGPKHVAYTIFPQGLYKGRSCLELFDAYNRPGGYYDRVKTLWGTYFRRMTYYEEAGKVENQLMNIIEAIKKRQKLSKAAYTALIQQPGGETVRTMGGPCLNYLAIQAERSQQSGRPILGILAVYRNHDFLKRAYGNYWGLCNLAQFLSSEAGGEPGPLTCLSSHAYVSDKKLALRDFMEKL